MFKIIGADGKEYGPISGDQIRQWIREGRANAQTRIQLEGRDDWTTLGEFSEFEDVLGRKPEAIPPVGGQSLLPSDVTERDYDLDVGDCVSRGADLLKNNFGIIFGASAIYLLIQIVLSGLGSIPFVGPVISIGSLFVLGHLIAGVYLVILKTIRQQPTEAGEVFIGFKTAYVQLLLAYLVVVLLSAAAAIPGGIMTAVPVLIMVNNDAVSVVAMFFAVLGVLVVLVPAIYLTVIWMFTLPLVIDKGLGFWQAMETSRKVVSKHWWSVFALLIVVGLINVLGFLLCCVGLFFTFPLGFAAAMYAYETLFSSRETGSA